MRLPGRTRSPPACPSGWYPCWVPRRSFVVLSDAVLRRPSVDTLAGLRLVLTPEEVLRRGRHGDRRAAGVALMHGRLADRVLHPDRCALLVALVVEGAVVVVVRHGLQ